MKLVKLLLKICVFCAITIGGIFMYLNIFKPNNNGIGDASETKNIFKRQVVLSDNELKDKIGQMIMIGFRETRVLKNSDTYKMIKDVKPGGVILFDYDFPSNSFPRNIINYDQTKKLISDIQNYSTTPLFIAVDAEGGNVNRLKPKYGFLPIISEEKMGQDKTLQTTYKESMILATELKNLGFNMDFAPVVDININPQNPIIGALGRSFSSDASEVLYNSKLFIKNLQKNNIIAVAKHFPGQGSATEDSHKEQVDITNTYKDEELLPYQGLNNDGLLKAVMVAHVINKNVDENYPATLSKIFLQNILRKQIGFDGVIISDDMQMGAISKNYNLDDAVIKSINAGIDMIMISNDSPSGYDKDLALKIRDIIFNAVKNGNIREQRIIESFDRILNLKKEFNIIY